VPPVTGSVVQQDSFAEGPQLFASATQLGAVHAPPVQAGSAVGHATPDPHCPAAEQVSTLLPAHLVVPGVHTPLHMPLTHPWFVHGVTVPHCPLAEQIRKPFPEHSLVDGAHTPTHALVTHAWFVHGTPSPHCPLDVQVCKLLPEHCFAFGAHTPTHPPLTHA